MLLWKLGHENVLTNMERKRRMMTPSSVCPNCNEEDETLFHCFRDCRKSLSLWYNFKARKQNNFFREENWINWLGINLQQGNNEEEEPYWHIVFGVVIDTI